VKARAGRVLLAVLTIASAASGAPRHKRGRVPPALGEILARMDEASKHLKTVSANLEYTKVTVVVNDRSTQYGKLYYRNSKSPEILLDFEKPDAKMILFKKNKGEIYLPKINQVQEYDLSHHSEIVQQFLLLGFGTESSSLKKAYDVKLIGEEEVNGDTTAVLELAPQKASVAAQIAKVQLWISEGSWLPVEQKFFEPDGDYLETKYTSVVVNRELPSSIFEIPAAKGAKRVKMG
jgi:outer membrane lipoprotein carrier protein